jgi:ABC-type dipeptide/oligopeptide/nickel transport system ATPase component
MGNRRLSRKRLYQVEKLGQTIDLESSAGIKDAIKSATQHRQGQEIITEIAIDLGVTGILGGGGDDGVIGKSTTASAITRLTYAKYGYITEIRAVVMEAPVGGHTQVNVATKANEEVQDNTATERIADLATIGQDASLDVDNYATLQTLSSEHYLFLTNAGGGNNAAMTAGKILIYLHGFVAPDDL